MLNTSKKIAEIRKLLIKNKIDYYLIPHSDEYQNEFLPNYSKRLEWISNFTGSAGDVIVGIKEAYLFVDGRYTIQAQNEVNKGQYKIFNYNKLTPLSLLKLKKARNVIPVNQGGIERRSGSVYRADLGAVSRIEPFIFNESQEYIFAFQNQSLKI